MPHNAPCNGVIKQSEEIFWLLTKICDQSQWKEKMVTLLFVMGGDSFYKCCLSGTASNKCPPEILEYLYEGLGDIHPKILNFPKV